MSICKDCSNARNIGDFIQCIYWGKIVATWGMGYKWKDTQECTAKNKDPISEDMRL